jgi:predicted RNase H-like nuclease (RuvC/YqgF family)
MATLREVQRQLAERLEELRRRDAVIEYLEREVAERDVLIRHLKNEIDKFQQVVRPLTQQLTRVHRVGALVPTPQRPVRTKRQAISAEPLGHPGDHSYEELLLPLEIVHKPDA